MGVRHARDGEDLPACIYKMRLRKREFVIKEAYNAGL